jgi:aryl-alcohol dehydrogenase-like predicted oxidoreductase
MDLGARPACWKPRAPRKEGPDYTAAPDSKRRGYCARAPIASAWCFSRELFRTTMEYRRLGESGLEVSVICLGTMMFGDRTDAATAQRIVASAFDAGVNFLDTADVYAKGASETIVGPTIAANRRRWILATKVGNVMKAKPHDGGLSRRWVMQACDDSLRRLATDYIDIYYLHRDDTETPLEETIEAMGDLIRAGKVRYFGVSNYRGWRVAEVVGLCAELNVPRPVVCQPYYNAFNRTPEVELLPACDYYGLGVVPYSPLARGVLTGKYAPGATPPAESRVARKDQRMMETEFRPESIAMAQTIKAHAEKKGLTATQFALAWVLNNQIVSSVIAGPRTFDQWVDYLSTVGKTLDADDETFIDSLVTPGHPSTPGYNDPQYPFYGRLVG